jgi:hypothetical protein
MDLRINDHILMPGKFYGLVAPVNTMLSGINDNPAIVRYLTLFVSGNFSRLLNGVSRETNNFSIRRAFTVHQLLTILHEIDQSIVVVEHDPTIYADAGDVRRIIPSAMKSVSRDRIFILYSPTMEKHFSYLADACDHLIVYDEDIELWTRPTAKRKNSPYVQRTLT